GDVDRQSSAARVCAVPVARAPSELLVMTEPLASNLNGYFYCHGARGAFLKKLGRAEEAQVAFDRAIALANTPAEAAHIRRQIERLAAEGAMDQSNAARQLQP